MDACVGHVRRFCHTETQALIREEWNNYIGSTNLHYRNIAQFSDDVLHTRVHNTVILFHNKETSHAHLLYYICDDVNINVLSYKT